MNTITLKVNGTGIKFNIDVNAQEQLIDAMGPGNKVGPMNNFLTRTVAEESKEALKPFLKEPSAVMRIGEKVVELAAPDLQITVGE